MPLDPSIPISGQQQAPIDPLAVAMKGFTLKAAQQQAQLGDLELQDSLTLREAFKSPGARNPDGSINYEAILKETAGKISPKMMTTLSTGAQQQVEKQSKMKQDLSKAWGPVAAGLYTKYKELGGNDQAWAQVQPMAQQAWEQTKQQFPGAQIKENPMTPQSLEQNAMHWDKYTEQQMKKTQPETPHEQRISAAAEKRADAAASSADDTIPPETLHFMARQALTGDTSVIQNIGRGKQGSKNIKAFREELRKTAQEMGISPEELAARNAEFFGTKAGERALGTRTAQVGMAVAEAQRMIPLALKASEEATRTGFKSLNDIQQAVQKGTASPALRKFVAANNSLVNVYSRAVSPTGTPTVSDKDHAREVLSVGFSKGDYKAAVEQLQAEMEAAQASPGDVRKEFRESVTGKKETGGQKRRPLSEFSGG
jgi:hypothetical protein